MLIYVVSFRVCARWQAFSGNSNSESAVRHELQQGTVVRFLRFVPLQWSAEGRIGLRIEVYGCSYCECRHTRTNTYTPAFKYYPKNPQLFRSMRIPINSYILKYLMLFFAQTAWFSSHLYNTDWLVLQKYTCTVNASLFLRRELQPLCSHSIKAAKLISITIFN